MQIQLKSSAVQGLSPYLYILSIATFVVLQSIFPQPTDNGAVDEAN